MKCLNFFFEGREGGGEEGQLKSCKHVNIDHVSINGLSGNNESLKSDNELFTYEFSDHTVR